MARKNEENHCPKLTLFDFALLRLGLSSLLIRHSPLLEHTLAEPVAPLLASLVKAGSYTHLAGPHSALGKNLFPRVAGLLNVQQVRHLSPPFFLSLRVELMSVK